MKKTVPIKTKTITVFEYKGFFRRPQITEQKTKFDQDCKTLLTLFAKLAKVNKLPKNAEEMIANIAQSYKNTEACFTKRQPKAAVLDVDIVLDELVK